MSSGIGYDRRVELVGKWLRKHLDGRKCGRADEAEALTELIADVNAIIPSQLGETEFIGVLRSAWDKWRVTEGTQRSWPSTRNLLAWVAEVSPSSNGASDMKRFRSHDAVAASMIEDRKPVPEKYLWGSASWRLVRDGLVSDDALAGYRAQSLMSLIETYGDEVGVARWLRLVGRHEKSLPDDARASFQEQMGKLRAKVEAAMGEPSDGLADLMGVPA